MFKALAFILVNIFALIISYCIGGIAQTIWDDVTWIIQGGDLSSMISPSGIGIAALVIIVCLVLGYQVIYFSGLNTRKYIYFFVFYIIVYLIDFVFLSSPLVCPPYPEGEFCAFGVLLVYLPISFVFLLIFNGIVTFVLAKKKNFMSPNGKKG